MTNPGPIGFGISTIASQGIDWPKLDATWALAGELDVFDAGWMSDHLSEASRELHLKLDKLIRATKGARNAFIDEEHETEAGLKRDEASMRDRAERT